MLVLKLLVFFCGSAQTIDAPSALESKSRNLSACLLGGSWVPCKRALKDEVQCLALQEVGSGTLLTQDPDST